MEVEFGKITNTRKDGSYLVLPSEPGRRIVSVKGCKPWFQLHDRMPFKLRKTRTHKDGTKGGTDLGSFVDERFCGTVTREPRGRACLVFPVTDSDKKRVTVKRCQPWVSIDDKIPYAVCYRKEDMGGVHSAVFVDKTKVQNSSIAVLGQTVLDKNLSTKYFGLLGFGELFERLNIGLVRLFADARGNEKYILSFLSKNCAMIAPCGFYFRWGRMEQGLPMHWQGIHDVIEQYDKESGAKAEEHRFVHVRENLYNSPPIDEVMDIRRISLEAALYQELFRVLKLDLYEIKK
ncbi:hypothetical protein KY325_01855 [Candidatus Woesearchaeota archaeon]|nr:hypothetical protein [Candidatus Woesearchaeota archaeon]MBW3017883.1 hypothetical protein [Candidatus Woesearchaeota archaeon]